MSKLLGLDISTTFIGACVLDASAPLAAPLVLDHIEFKKHDADTMWTKADHVRDVLTGWCTDQRFSGIEHVFIEDAAKRFSPGMSSAETIGTLLRFNGLTSFLVHDIFSIDPEYIAVGQARKLCGLKMQQKAKAGGAGHKQQTYDAIMSSDLKGTVWPVKKSGKTVEWSSDIVDAYVVAKAGHVLLNSSAGR